MHKFNSPALKLNASILITQKLFVLASFAASYTHLSSPKPCSGFAVFIARCFHLHMGSLDHYAPWHRLSITIPLGIASLDVLGLSTTVPLDVTSLDVLGLFNCRASATPRLCLHIIGTYFSNPVPMCSNHRMDPSQLHPEFRSALKIRALEGSYQWGKIGLLKSGEAHGFGGQRR